jgi:hypothetical protein
MKAIYFLLKSFVVIGLAIVATHVNAKEITVNGGTDADLAAALDLAETGDVILIKGWLDFNTSLEINKNVHIKGATGNDGFSGQKKTKLFELVPEAIDGAKLVFEDLVFVEGYNTESSAVEEPGAGGVGRILAGTTEFRECYFENNYAERGGVWYISGEETNVHFDRCEATNNQANSRGGFIFSANGNVNYDYCKVIGNSTVTERGGALVLHNNSNHRFFYTLFENNSAGVEPGEGEKGGGVLVTDGSPTVRFESCVLYGNKAHNHGSIGFLMGTPNVTFLNTSIIKNKTLTGSGGLTILGGTVTFVNVTYADNEGQNAGNAGGGVAVWNKPVKLDIFNSIFVRNYCENGEGAVDMRYNGADYIATTTFKNSIVGLIAGVDKSAVTPLIQDKAGIAAKSKINMYNIGGVSAQTDYVQLDESGVDFMDGVQETVYWRMKYYTLMSGGYATKLGDPALLEMYDDTFGDQFLVERSIASDGSIFVGAIQAVVDYESFDDTPIVNAINNPDALPNEIVRVIGSVRDGVLNVDFGEWRGCAQMDILSISGQIVEQVCHDRSVIGKDRFNIHVAPGFYILRGTVDGKIFAKRLIVGK